MGCLAELDTPYSRAYGFMFFRTLVIGLGSAFIAASAFVALGCGSGSATAKNESPTAMPRVANDDKQQVQSNTVEQALNSQTAAPQPAPRRGDGTKALEKAGDRPFDKTFDDIKFEMEVGAPFKRSMLTPAIEAMVGQRIRIRGYMLPTAQKRGIKQFVLVRDNQECCFGPGAALYDCIFVEMQPGKSAEFSIRPMAVTGTFGVNEIIGPDGKHLAIYHLAAEEAKL